MNEKTSTYDSHWELDNEQAEGVSGKQHSSFGKQLIVVLGIPVLVYSVYLALFSRF